MIRRLPSHRDALEGLPLKLTIVLLLISLSFPIFVNSLQQYERTLTSEAIGAEMERLESIVISTLLGGPGSMRSIDLHLPDGCDAQQILIEIGGKSGTAEARSLRYHVGDVSGKRIIEDLPLDISSPDGGPTIITSLRARLTIEYLQDEAGSRMEVRLIS